VAACIHGASEAFFWTAYHLHFLRSSNNKARGRIISIIRVRNYITHPHITSPLTYPCQLDYYKGWKSNRTCPRWVVFTRVHIFTPLFDQKRLISCIFRSHTTWLVIVSTFLLGISVLPLYWVDSKDDDEHLEVHEPLNGDPIPQSVKDDKPIDEHRIATVICFITNGIEKGYGNTIWPLYTALVFFNQKVKLFGAFSSIVLIASLVLTFAIGKFVDTVRDSPLYSLCSTNLISIGLHRSVTNLCTWE